MQGTRVVTVIVAFVVACGDGKSSLDAGAIEDAPSDGASDAPACGPTAAPSVPAGSASGCDALTQGGCNSGEKCAYIDEGGGSFRLGCAPVGMVALGCPCTVGAFGATGYDDCVAGSACSSGICRSICALSGDAPSCGQEQGCTGLHGEGRNTATLPGVCEPACDPLTQDLQGASACGSADPSQPSRGCYGNSHFTCASAGPDTWSLTDRMQPRASTGGLFLNDCAPGFIPFFIESAGSTTVLCTGFCAALEIDNTPAHVGNAKGNANALAKLPLSAAAVVGDGTCDAGKKGSHASSSCRFMWPFLQDGDGMLPPGFAQGPLLDTLGVCRAFALFEYDTNNDNIPDTPFPDCATLPPRSAGTPGDYDDAADWGCQKRSNSQFTSAAARAGRVLHDMRLGGGPAAPRMRHTLVEAAVSP